MIRLYRLACGLLAALAAAPPAAAQAPPAVPHLVGTMVAPDGNWDYASVDPSARRLYVARGDGVLLVDLAAARIVPRWVPGQGVHAVLPLPEGRVLTTNGRSRTAALFDAGSGRPLGHVAAGQMPDGAAFDPASGRAVVVDRAGGQVFLVDPLGAHAPIRLAVGGTLEFAVADGRGRVFVNVEDRNEIAVIDVVGHRVVATRWALPGCEEPSGLAHDPVRGLLLSVCGNRTAVALDATTGRVIATPAIGAGADAAIFDPVSRRVFVPNGDDGTLSVIAVPAVGPIETVASVATAVGARTGALDPTDGLLYLPVATARPGATGFDPPTIPGSFRLLVLATR